MPDNNSFYGEKSHLRRGQDIAGKGGGCNFKLEGFLDREIFNGDVKEVRKVSL
jgi:hypothetical protein